MEARKEHQDRDHALRIMDWSRGRFEPARVRCGCGWAQLTVVEPINVGSMLPEVRTMEKRETGSHESTRDTQAIVRFL